MIWLRQSDTAHVIGTSAAGFTDTENKTSLEAGRKTFATDRRGQNINVDLRRHSKYRH